MTEAIAFFAAVRVVSPDPARLAAFYRDVLGVPLETTVGAGFACDLGDVRFVIEQGAAQSAPGAMSLAFVVFDLDAFADGLTARGVSVERAREQTVDVRDADGHVVTFHQADAARIGALETRRRAGHDVLLHWRMQPQRR